MGATGATANPPKSDDKYAQKSVQLVRGSSFLSDFLQNPYFKLKYLEISSCGGNTELILESFLESCKSLEKLKCDGLQDQNGSPINYGMKSQKLANILNNLFIQNGQTLQVCKIGEIFQLAIFFTKTVLQFLSLFSQKVPEIEFGHHFLSIKNCCYIPILSASQIFV